MNQRLGSVQKSSVSVLVFINPMFCDVHLSFYYYLRFKFSLVSEHSVISATCNFKRFGSVSFLLDF